MDLVINVDAELAAIDREMEDLPRRRKFWERVRAEKLGRQDAEEIKGLYADDMCDEARYEAHDAIGALFEWLRLAGDEPEWDWIFVGKAGDLLYGAEATT